VTLKSSAREFASRVGLSVDRWPARETSEEILGQIVRRYGPDAAVDVGASVGRWSARMRRVGYDGFIISIEPGYEAFAQLEAASRKDPRWSVLRAAAGRTKGEMTLHVARSTSTSSLLPVTAHYVEIYDRAGVDHVEQVPVVTLDSLDVPGDRVLVKIDTQGFDFEVLQGASVLLERVVAVQCELSIIPVYEGMTNPWREMVDWFEGQGFVLGGLFPLMRDDQLRLHEMDGVFVRPESLQHGWNRG
jgi:FkbM family methyltransferase